MTVKTCFRACFHGMFSHCFHVIQFFQQSPKHHARGWAWRSAGAGIRASRHVRSSDWKCPADGWCFCRRAPRRCQPRGGRHQGHAPAQTWGSSTPPACQSPLLAAGALRLCGAACLQTAVRLHLLAGGRAHQTAVVCTLLRPPAPRLSQRQCHRHHAPASIPSC